MTAPGALEEAARLLASAETVLVATGAGVSAESGIPVFRGPGGLWEGHDPDEVATPEAFARDPRAVWEFYAGRIARHRHARPNAAHRALATLEEWCAGRGTEFLLATQNVDGFHAAAGSRNLVELHGTLARVRCDGCGAERETATLPLDRLPPLCACGEPLRPDVVWFGERLPERELERAMEFAARGGVGLVVGTSNLVWPAASLPLLVLEAGGNLVEVNPERTELTGRARAHLAGAAGTLLPALVASLPAHPGNP